MTQSQFEKLLRNAGKLARERDFFLIGSQALRTVCRSVPRDFPKTMEADLYPRRYPQAWALLRQEMGNRSAFFRQHGFYLDCTDPGLATLPNGWTDRLIPFRTPRTSGVTAWGLDPNDLFVSKLVAWWEKDQIFLRCMLRHKFAKPSVAKERIAEVALPESRKSRLVELLDQLVSEIRKSKRARR